jgi:hypothetical protein
MKLEEQVVSLELARRLKELGVKQESAFYWYDGEMLFSRSPLGQAHTYNETITFSAFTVAELGEILPSERSSFYDVKFNTLIPGCAIGQAITVNLPAFNINKQLVIKRVEAVGFAPGPNGKLEYKIECIGSDNVTFTDLMTTLLQQEANQTPVDDSTVNENLEVVDEAVAVMEMGARGGCTM